MSASVSREQSQGQSTQSGDEELKAEDEEGEEDAGIGGLERERGRTVCTMDENVNLICHRAEELSYRVTTARYVNVYMYARPDLSDLAPDCSSPSCVDIG